MQQASAAPANAAAEATTPTPAVAGTQAQVAVPTTSAELRGLTAQRSELERQLEQLMDRRQQLARQRQSMAGRQGEGLDQRIGLIDQQAAQIERTLMQLNTAIAQGTAQVAATSGDEAFSSFSQFDPGAQLRRDVRNAAEDAVIETMVGGAFGALALYLIVWRGIIRRFIWKKKPVVAPAIPDHSPRLEQLQQSVDVIALEVERISEAQRYLAKVMNERALGAGEAQPVSVKNRDVIGDRR